MSRRVVLIITTFIFTTAVSFGQARKIKTIHGKTIRVKQLNSRIQATMDSLQIPGLSIAIINNGEIVYHQVFGIMDIESKKPVDNETLFEGASLSKPLFSYFFLKMVDKGVVTLDEPLYKILPHPSIKDNDERYKLITPRMVLSHSTGFPNWSKDKPVELAYTPGNGFSYSGEAHQYLTAYLATACKINWQEQLDSLFQNEVAVLLGMKNTWFVGNAFFNQHKATGYEGVKPKPLWLPKAFGAAHTVHTEALDFAKFLQAMITGKGLSENLYTEMLTEQNHFDADNKLLDVGQTGWSLGFSMKPTPNGIRYLHTGNNTGFRAYACFYKEKKYGLVLLMNNEKISELYTVVGKLLEDEF